MGRSHGICFKCGTLSVYDITTEKERRSGGSSAKCGICGTVFRN